MNPDSFCTEFQHSAGQGQTPSGRRLSTSWDNDSKMIGLMVPRVDQRRNSNTLAQLLECHRRLSMSQDNSLNSDYEEIQRSRPPSRRASVGSRRPSIAEMLVDSGVSKTTDDCLMVTQTLGTSTTLFFQKNPLVDNLDLRPSPVERGLFNFDDSIKEVPPMKYFGTPRPSIQLPQSPRPSTLVRSPPSIDESDGQTTPTLTMKDLPVRPSIGERGLPAMKFTPVLANGQLPPRGRTLHKQPRADPRFDFELDKIIASRRKIIDEEETKRERENQIRPRNQQNTKRVVYSRPHNFDGRTFYQATGKIMEELRNQMEGGEVDRIVKEKKTTTVTETREIVYFTHRLPSSIAISTRLSPTGVPVQNPHRRSITVEGSLPELLDRPYVRASPQDGKNTLPDGKTPTKTVTIRIPPDHQQQLPKGHIGYRSATPSSSSQNVRLLTAAEKAALRHNASKFDTKPPTDHPLDDAADNLTTTTTTTPAPYPCSVCPKIYGQGCLGTGATDFCATVAQVGLTYTLGILTGYNYGDSNTCSTIFSCPVGTTSKVKLPITGTIVPGPSLVIATCQETGANAGTWYYGIPPISTPVEIVATSCVGILSG